MLMLKKSMETQPPPPSHHATRRLPRSNCTRAPAHGPSPCCDGSQHQLRSWESNPKPEIKDLDETKSEKSKNIVKSLSNLRHGIIKIGWSPVNKIKIGLATHGVPDTDKMPKMFWLVMLCFDWEWTLINGWLKNANVICAVRKTY